MPRGESGTARDLGVLGPPTQERRWGRRYDGARSFSRNL